MKITEKYKAAFLHLPDGILAAEAEAETEAELTVILRNGAHDGSSASDVTALFVRTIGEKAGFAYTQNLDENPADVLKRAHESSLYSESEGVPILDAVSGGYTEKEPECELTEPARLWEKAELIDHCLAAGAPQLTLRRISVTDRIRTISLANSRGRDCQTSSHSFCVSLFAADSRYPGNFLMDEITVLRMEDITEDLFRHSLKRWYWKQEAQNEAEVSAEVNFQPGSFRCVLDGSVVNNIFITGWRMFTKDNYEKNATPFAGKKNDVVGNSALNIVDRVMREGSGYVYRADCEGSIGKDVNIVTNGILTGFMSSLADGDSTGNAGRKAMISGNIHTDTVTMPKNFGIEPGVHTLEELIRELRDGIYIYESFDMFHSVNTVSGEYSIPCNGILIRNGRPAGTVKGLTVNGKVQDIIREIVMVGCEVQVQPMLMLNSFTVASPDVLVNKMDVSK